MTIGLKCLTDKLNSSLGSAASLSVSDAAAVGSAVASLTSNNLDSVTSLTSLPSASANQGRLICVADVCQYRYSNGFEWVNTFTTTTNTKNRCIWVWGSVSAITGGCYVSPFLTRTSPVVFDQAAGRTWCSISVDSFIFTDGASAIKTDGTLWTWGQNCYGQLGNNSTTFRYSPVTTTGGGTTWCCNSTSANINLAIKTDGTLWTWGINSYGQLGDGTTANRSSPVTTTGGGNNWCTGSAGRFVSAGIKTNGTLWTWGRNIYGGLGDSTTTNRSSPGTTTGGFTNWCAVSTKDGHSAALTSDGLLWTWGKNSDGQLADEATANRSSPFNASFKSDSTLWCKVSTGGYTTIGIKVNGTLWMWGRNSYGQLGDGTTFNRSSPVTVAGGGTTWCLGVTAFDNSAAIKSDNTLWTWGKNGNGLLGDGTSSYRSSPGTTAGGGTTWSRVDLGFTNTLAIQNSGTIGF
jgi:hypothetical protein